MSSTKYSIFYRLRHLPNKLVTDDELLLRHVNGQNMLVFGPRPEQLTECTVQLRNEFYNSGLDS
jgi:hypothetical protein